MGLKFNQPPPTTLDAVGSAGAQKGKITFEQTTPTKPINATPLTPAKPTGVAKKPVKPPKTKVEAVPTPHVEVPTVVVKAHHNVAAGMQDWTDDEWENLTQTCVSILKMVLQNPAVNNGAWRAKLKGHIETIAGYKV